ncbi:MAG TPA: pantetheine-phosphate adenylyltransferase [Ignavibacteria bacterium]|nr:pantetheine-phosphate adenylyltransferase [Ignavibacteria bacterium]
MAKITAIYPGTFDPLTLGHLDVIKRASVLFDKIIVAAAISTSKNTLLNIDERTEIITDSVSHITNCTVERFDGLLVDFAKQKGADVIIRGLRAISDFEYEFQMALTNRKIAGNIETVFLMPSEKYSYISSTLVREIAKYGGNVSEFVPAEAVKAIKLKLDTR